MKNKRDKQGRFIKGYKQLRGKNHPNWKGGKITKKCLKCGKKFKSKPHAKRKYCSLKCFHFTQMLNLTKICIECNKLFKINSTLRFKEAKFCSKKCYWKTKKGMISPMKGKTHSFATREKNRKSHLKLFQDITKHPRYKFGKFIDAKGYVMIPTSKWRSCHSPKHNGKRQRIYRLEHRVIMEKILNRSLEKYELVHHKNGIKTDNRPENLTILTNSNHYSEIICPFCSKKFLMK